MATDKKPQNPDHLALATTETDFARSVDREIIRQVGGMNLRGVRILREALESSKIVLPSAASMLREEWLGLEDGVLASVADCPYLLFDLSTDNAFALWRRVQAGVGLPRLPAGLCEGPGRAGVRAHRVLLRFADRTVAARGGIFVARALARGLGRVALTRVTANRRARRNRWALCGITLG